MKAPTLFDQEAKIIEAAEKILAQEEVPTSKADYASLLKNYKKLSKQFGRIVNINDRQEKSLKAEVNKRAAAEVQLREHQKELVIAKEAAEQALIDKASFFASMSHEIRTPLNGVLGAAQVLSTSELNEKQKDYIDTIITSGKILMVVINDILDFSKIELGNLELESRALDLEECLEQVVDLLGLSAAEKNLELIYQAPDLTHCILADPTRLAQVLVNLVNNAIKFTKQGHISITAEITHETTNKMMDGSKPKEILFCVADTGIGIPTDRVDRLFKAFSQVESSTARKFGGTGLGLSICQKLAEQWGGKIWVESLEGQGSKFFFTLPYLESTTKTRAKPDIACLKGKRVLVIESNPLLLQKLVNYCETEGMLVSAFADPAAFLSKFDAQVPPELLVVDQTLPNIKGYQLIEEIYQLYANSIPTLLLLAKGAAVPAIFTNRIQGGLVNKPIKHFPFLKAVSKVLQGQKLETLGDSSGPTKYEFIGKEIPIKILIAEDNLINQKIARAAFEIIGYEVTIVDDGKAALEEACSEAYHVVFMDVQMPVMDGIEATVAIKDKLDKNAPIIIAMTANATAEDKKDCSEAGMDFYLAKPLVIEELVGLIKEIFQVEGKTNQILLMAKNETSEPQELFDQELLSTLKRTYPAELLEELSEIYLKDLDQVIGEIDQSFRCQDTSLALRLTHKLKGASLNMGIKKIAFHLSKLEEIVTSKDPSNLDYHLAELKNSAAPTGAGLKSQLGV
ncbi:MAG: response regulator [SAR324 cluster bacterium]|nr:response regulator [SAR324 cluster bacterium]